MMVAKQDKMSRFAKVVEQNRTKIEIKMMRRKKGHDRMVRKFNRTHRQQTKLNHNNIFLYLYTVAL